MSARFTIAKGELKPAKIEIDINKVETIQTCDEFTTTITHRNGLEYTVVGNLAACVITLANSAKGKQ